MKSDLLIKYLAALGTLCLVFLGYFHAITALTQDLGRHLFTGELILKTLQIPHVNLYSYTFPDFPFINHHWLAEVVFALIYRFGGFAGLFLLMLLLLTAALTLQLKAVIPKVTSLALGLSGILYTGILLERTDLRPELFSFFLLSVFITLLYRYRQHATKSIFLLIPLQLLWVNMHIYFAVGLVVISRPRAGESKQSPFTHRCPAWSGIFALLYRLIAESKWDCWSSVPVARFPKLRVYHRGKPNAFLTRVTRLS
jgi:hypothetical protein